MESLKETLYGYAFVTGGPGSGTTTTAMKLVTAIVSGGVGETRQHEPKLTVAVESDPATSNKPDSTGWLDVDDDDTCSEDSFCSAVSLTWLLVLVLINLNKSTSLALIHLTSVMTPLCRRATASFRPGVAVTSSVGCTL